MTDPIKQAFTRAKQDIQMLKDLILDLRQEIQDIKTSLAKQAIVQLDQEAQQSSQQTNRQTHSPTQILSENQENQANQHINPSESPTHQASPTQNWPLEASKSPISKFSTGNGGVPTDRQTNQQTDRHTTNNPQKFALTQKPSLNPKINSLEKVAEVINSLDDIKRDLRTQFKRLSKQEMLVFSTIYQLEEQGFIVDYSLLAQKLSLSESSIRDYTQKIIKKQAPLQKTKENNKKIYLSILPELKKLASLQTILALREI